MHTCSTGAACGTHRQGVVEEAHHALGPLLGVLVRHSVPSVGDGNQPRAGGGKVGLGFGQDGDDLVLDTAAAVQWEIWCEDDSRQQCTRQSRYERRCGQQQQQELTAFSSPHPHQRVLCSGQAGQCALPLEELADGRSLLSLGLGGHHRRQGACRAAPTVDRFGDNTRTGAGDTACSTRMHWPSTPCNVIPCHAKQPHTTLFFSDHSSLGMMVPAPYPALEMLL